MLPTAVQLERILANWEALLPTTAFDVAYSWGTQNGHVALESSPELQAVLSRHNHATEKTAEQPDLDRR
jgi:hypothetical protein